MTANQIIEFGDIMSMKKFLSLCDSGCFINYDGFAHPVVKNVELKDIVIRPSQTQYCDHRRELERDYDVVIWYNR